MEWQPRVLIAAQMFLLEQFCEFNVMKLQLASHLFLEWIIGGPINGLITNGKLQLFHRTYNWIRGPPCSGICLVGDFLRIAPS